MTKHSIILDEIDAIVFDFDGEVTADRFNKNEILNGDVWMSAVVVLVSCGFIPAEFMLRWISNLVLASIINVFDCVRSNSPFE